MADKPAANAASSSSSGAPGASGGGEKGTGAAGAEGAEGGEEGAHEHGDEAAPPGSHKNPPVTFPIGDWFLGAGDAAVGREGERGPKKSALEEGMGGFFAKAGGLMKAAQNGDASGAVSAMTGQTHGYMGELQILEDHRSSTIVFSDVTDSSRFTCLDGPKGGERPVAEGSEHPVIQFSEPHEKVHVHLEDMAAGPGRHVHWDAVYDLGGTETLKHSLLPERGTRPDFELFCPPTNGPPHWYELTVTRAGRDGFNDLGYPEHWKAKPRILEDFIGSQVFTTYRPDHDPDIAGFAAGMGKAKGNGSCAVQ